MRLKMAAKIHNIMQSIPAHFEWPSSTCYFNWDQITTLNNHNSFEYYFAALCCAVTQERLRISQQQTSKTGTIRMWTLLRHLLAKQRNRAIKRTAEWRISLYQKESRIYSETTAVSVTCKVQKIRTAFIGSHSTSHSFSHTFPLWIYQTWLISR